MLSRNITSSLPASESPADRKGLFLRFIDQQRRALSALGFFVVLLVLFTIANPKVLLNPLLWSAIFVNLPLSIILAVALVFIISSGEIDLSFGSVMGMAGWAFAVSIQHQFGPYIGMAAALLTGAMCGLLNGWLITRLKLSSLVVTLGMSFLLRGLINIGNQGFGISLTSEMEGSFTSALVSKWNGIPVQLFWAIGFVILSWLLFNRHVFGVHLCCIGNNPDSAREMGIDVASTKTAAYIYMGLTAAFVGVLSSLLSMTFYPTNGDGFMLPVLAAVFVGGTPTWGGIGTIIGAVIGACSVGIIDTGIIAAGLTGFYTQFFYGLIIIVSLISHRFNRSNTRY